MPVDSGPPIFAYPEASNSCNPWCPVGMPTFESALNEYWLSENYSSGGNTYPPYESANPSTLSSPYESFYNYQTATY